MSRTKLRLLLADDHAELLHQVAELLAGEFDVVGTARDGVALLEAAAELKPDVVVCDLKMPEMSGIEAGRKLLAAQLCKAVVLLTIYGDADLAVTALKTGISGYVLKANAGEDLIPAIYAVMAGRTFVSSDIASKYTT